MFMYDTTDLESLSIAGYMHDPVKKQLGLVDLPDISIWNMHYTLWEKVRSWSWTSSGLVNELGDCWTKLFRELVSFGARGSQDCWEAGVMADRKVEWSWMRVEGTGVAVVQTLVTRSVLLFTKKYWIHTLIYKHTVLSYLFSFGLFHISLSHTQI